MNDFSIEELEEMNRCLNYMINGGTTPYSNQTIEIRRKLRSMIDNYCEHKPGIFISNDGRSLKCLTCNKEF